MWVLDKLRLTVECCSREVAFPGMGAERVIIGRPSDDINRKGIVPFVLTPDRIPEFCIPPQMTTELKKGASPCRHRSAPNIRLSSLKAAGDQRSADGLDRFFATEHIIQIDSADETPCDLRCSDDESTNADPQSQAALSLPHLPKACTSYGFSTLLESPNTRRKESIYHNDPFGAEGVACLLPRSSTFCKGGTASSLHISLTTARRSPSDTSVLRPCTWDSDTTTSTESSPMSSPLLHRSNSIFKSFSQERLFYRAFKVKSRYSATRNNSVSTDEGSSTDSSPSVLRRASEGPMETLPSLLSGFSHLPLDCSHRERFIRETVVFLDSGALLRLSAEYCPENNRLQVRLISAEGLYEASREPKRINCCVTLSLLPGKVQKQRSTLICKSRNPIFNEDFYFGISKDDLNNMSLKIKAINKVHYMKRDCVLGRSELCLVSILRT